MIVDYSNEERTTVTRKNWEVVEGDNSYTGTVKITTTDYDFEVEVEWDSDCPENWEQIEEEVRNQVTS
jgi:uncharacterized alkaline shock family protein YloU